MSHTYLNITKNIACRLDNDKENNASSCRISLSHGVRESWTKHGGKTPVAQRLSLSDPPTRSHAITQTRRSGDNVFLLVKTGFCRGSRRTEMPECAVLTGGAHARLSGRVTRTVSGLNRGAQMGRRLWAWLAKWPEFVDYSESSVGRMHLSFTVNSA